MRSYAPAVKGANTISTTRQDTLIIPRPSGQLHPQATKGAGSSTVKVKPSASEEKKALYKIRTSTGGSGTPFVVYQTSSRLKFVQEKEGIRNLF